MEGNAGVTFIACDSIIDKKRIKFCFMTQTTGQMHCLWKCLNCVFSISLLVNL